MQVSYTGLERQAAKWITNISAGVNANLSTEFIADALPDGRLKVTNTGRVPYAGGLVSCTLQPPTVPGFPLVFGRLSTRVLIPQFSVANLARLEFDFIQVVTGAPSATTPIANKFNFSTQWNGSTGHFMVDASAGAAAWSDIGDGPGAITPDVAHDVVVLFASDYAGLKRSVLSIGWDGKVYPVPAALQGVACQISNWQACMKVQKQTEIFTPGSTDVIYDQTNLVLSDQPLG